MEEDGRRAQPFSPFNFPNLELYLDSRFGVTAADGATFGTWEDQTANSRDALTRTADGFTDPTYWSSTVANLTPNGQPTVEWGLTTAFPGNILASAAFAFPTMARGYTFYHYERVLAKTAGPYPSVNQVMLAGHNGALVTVMPQLLLDSGGANRRLGIVDAAGGGAPKEFDTLASIAGAWKIHTVIFEAPGNNTTPCHYFVNGVEQTQFAGNPFGDFVMGMQGYSIGGAVNGNVVARCRQGFFIWYSDTHNQATINLFVAWAAALWGLT